MAVGFFNRFRRTPAAAASAPPVQSLVNAKNNANTQVLSNALKNYVKSIRNLRNQNPFGLSRNFLINQTAANRNKINRAIANYVMAVNKAKYMNEVARQAIPAAQTGAVPESSVAPIVAAAAQQNNATARAAQQVKLSQAATVANQYQGFTVNQFVSAASGFNAMNASTKNNFRHAIRAKLMLTNTTSPEYKIIKNINTRIGGRTAAAFVGPVNNQALSGVRQQIAKLPTRGNSLLRQAASTQTPRPPPVNLHEKTITAPNGRSIVVTRGNNAARWNFKNAENTAMYNLNNRYKNTPVISKKVNINASTLYGN